MQLQVCVSIIAIAPHVRLRVLLAHVHAASKCHLLKQNNNVKERKKSEEKREREREREKERERERERERKKETRGRTGKKKGREAKKF